MVPTPLPKPPLLNGTRFRTRPMIGQQYMNHVTAAARVSAPSAQLVGGGIRCYISDRATDRARRR